MFSPYIMSEKGNNCSSRPRVLSLLWCYIEWMRIIIKRKREMCVCVCRGLDSSSSTNHLPMHKRKVGLGHNPLSLSRGKKSKVHCVSSSFSHHHIPSKNERDGDNFVHNNGKRWDSIRGSVIVVYTYRSRSSSQLPSSCV
jgi:hypothetical protein